MRAWSFDISERRPFPSTEPVDLLVMLSFCWCYLVFEFVVNLFGCNAQHAGYFFLDVLSTTWSKMHLSNNSSRHISRYTWSILVTKLTKIKMLFSGELSSGYTHCIHYSSRMSVKMTLLILTLLDGIGNEQRPWNITQNHSLSTRRWMKKANLYLRGADQMQIYYSEQSWNR